MITMFRILLLVATLLLVLGGFFVVMESRSDAEIWMTFGIVLGGLITIGIGGVLTAIHDRLSEISSALDKADHARKA